MACLDTFKSARVARQLAFLPLMAASLAQAELQPAESDFFEKKVRPLLISRCYDCHSEEKGKARGGLTVDTKEALMHGGDSGAALIAGQPDKSLLIEAIRYQNRDLQMPPKSPLTPAEVAILEQWVQMGAPDPRSAKITSVKPARGIDLEQGRKHWAFRPLATPKPPVQAQGSRNPIDAFIQKSLADKGLKPAPTADKRSLIRRASFDLTGLPPTPEEVTSFLADTSPDAFAKVVERLLRSPHYGEKWGRHWLDVARYADSNGLDENVALGTAWRYRDYVVRSLNEDKPYDQFLTEQLAGDLLPSKDLKTRHERATATAFLNLGAKVLAEPDKEKLIMDSVDEQLDTLGRAFMGMTLGCVRCHDHKFDPISQEDYYALAAIFKSTSAYSADMNGAISFWHETPLGDLDDFARVISSERVLTAKKAEVSKAEGEAAKVLRTEAQARAADYLAAAASLPLAPSPAQAKAIAEPQGLRHQILLNCRVFLGANEEDPLFKEWHTAVRENRPQSIAAHYGKLFAQVGKTPPAKKPAAKAGAKDSTPAPFDPVAAAYTALNDTKGFLALPGEPSMLYSTETAARIHQLKDELDEVEKNLPDLPTTIGVRESDTILTSLKVHIRGSHTHLGKPVDRGFPKVMKASKSAADTFSTKASGRLEFARWLTQPEHPLTSRVIVNRVWTWHFNQGIVPTPDNFGLLGVAPTHPELLDWMARWFSSNGWSLKDLHRLIMLSETYQQASSVSNPQIAANLDPENQLLWHFPIRRLEAEEIRDAILSVSGTLDHAMGGKTVPLRNRQFVFNHTSKDATTYGSTRRALYLPIIRNNLYDLFQQFDYPDPATSTGLRNSTIVSPQALLLMNSELASQGAHDLAERVLKDPAASTDAARLKLAYQLTLSREATAKEIQIGQEFLTLAGNTLASSSATPLPDQEKQAWAMLSQSILMASEFIYLR